MSITSSHVVALLTIGSLGLASCAAGAHPAGSAGAPATSVSPTSAPGAGVASASAAATASAPPGSTAGSAPATAAGSPRASGGGPLSWNFDQDATGALPKGAQMFSGTWAVRAEADTPSPPNALCQTGTAEFPALSLSETPYTNLTMTTRFKPISGKEDQAAGLIFRIQDKDNYYVVRANALENNVMIFKYQGGRRSTIKSGSAKVPTGQWQEMRAEVNGDRIRGFVNGHQIVEANDGTFKAAGRVGLWAKSDSVTCFDDVSVTPGPA